MIMKIDTHIKLIEKNKKKYYAKLHILEISSKNKYLFSKINSIHRKDKINYR
jgi:hypothetical protein